MYRMLSAGVNTAESLLDVLKMSILRKGLTLTDREQRRIQMLNGVMDGKVAVASGLMGVSEHHTW